MHPFGNQIFFLLFLTYQTVQPWTIDLPEVRQYYFTKYGHVPPKHEVSKEPLKEGEFIYNNYYSNSPHHVGNPGYEGPVDHGHDDDHDEEVMKGGQYANDYEYQSYMEKKVNHVVESGARYLEGLRRAVEQYTQRLENCTTANFTTLVSSGTYESCKEATQKSEHVRRIAQLALYTTRVLQEKVYDQNHHQDPHEEKALLLRLASFLDTLTQLTGFEPNPAEPLSSTATSTSSTTTPAPPGIPLSDDMKRKLLDCMANRGNSPEPATERCKIPIPKAIMDFYNLTDDRSSPSSPVPSGNSASSNPRQRRAVPNPNLISKMTLNDQSSLQKGPTRHMASISNWETISKIVQDKKTEEDLLNGSDLETISKIVPDQNKRPVSDEDLGLETSSNEEQNPLVSLVNYYAKFKAWSNENPGLEDGLLKADFHDENQLKRSERSVDVQGDQKVLAWYIPRVPEDPMQDITAYISHRSQDFLNPDKDQADRIRNYIKDLAGQVKRPKRSYHESYRTFGRYRPYRARVPEDPHQDISYYVKYKEGTEIRRDPVQAAQVRLGLEQIFQTGNLAVVQRYGSNYNPLVVDQVTIGLLRSAADA